MCFPSANWKREEVPDHKFDFVDTRDYHTDAIGTRLQYVWKYVLLIKSFAVYLSDLFSAITMLTTKQWSNGIFEQCKAKNLDNCVVVDFSVGKWIFVGCIIFGYLLLMYEAWKAKKIILSRDISYTFTNVMAQNYYSFRSYDHFCFFLQIENSTKKKDDFAFFVFFTFKGWKRLILSDGPRQSINCLTLYSFWLVNQGSFSTMSDYWDHQSFVTKLLLLSMSFTVVIFLGSLLILIVAAVCYIPLLCYIQGNLKEYCCHKVDKRIAELVKRKNRQRVQRQAKLAQKEARGDFSHLKNNKGELVRNPIPQPTLPQLEIDEFSPAARPGAKSNYASSYATSAAKDDGYSDYYPGGAGGGVPSLPDLHGTGPDYPPPMPLYDQGQYGYAGNGGYEHSNYPASSRAPAANSEFANSATHLAPGAGAEAEYVDDVYGEAYQHHGHARGQSADHQYAAYPDEKKRTSTGGIAYDTTSATAEHPTTPHRRTASRQYDEDVLLHQQASDGRTYAEQWSGYGTGSPPAHGGAGGQGHGRQRSSRDEYGHGYGGAAPPSAM